MADSQQVPMFEIENLHASIEDKEILKGVNLTINMGEIHALMGPNGSGKSTLANVLAGHPSYEVTEGSIRFMGEDILEMEPDERAHLGIFLAFQYPTVIPGVSMANFLRMAVTNVRNALAGDEMGILLITHYQRLLNYIKPDFVHIMMDGRIVQSGGPELAAELEAKGYEQLRAEVAATA